MSYVTDPIGDLLTRMRNAQSARHASCCAPWSRLKEELCTLLQREGWLADVRVTGNGYERELEVVFTPGKILELRRVSTPGRRTYRSAEKIRPVLRGYGVAVLTTSQGLLTDVEARKRKIGGEVLCTIS